MRYAMSVNVFCTWFGMDFRCYDDDVRGFDDRGLLPQAPVAVVARIARIMLDAFDVLDLTVYIPSPLLLLLVIILYSHHLTKHIATSPCLIAHSVPRCQMQPYPAYADAHISTTSAGCYVTAHFRGSVPSLRPAVPDSTPTTHFALPRRAGFFRPPSRR
jgi:hypothetical protein